MTTPDPTWHEHEDDDGHHVGGGFDSHDDQSRHRHEGKGIYAIRQIWISKPDQ